jgi:PAS domain S-box-containing protein
MKPARVRSSSNVISLPAETQRLPDILHRSAEAISLVRLRDGCLIDVNDAFVRLTGYPRHETIGRTSLELGLWADPTDRVPYVEALERAGSVQGLEVGLRMRSGEIRLVQLYSSVTDAGGEPCILALNRDVTTRRRSEAALRDSEARFRSLSDASFEAIAIDDGTSVLDANRAFAAMFGYQPEDVVGMRPEAFGVEVAASDGGVDDELPHEAVGVRKDGTTFPMQTRTSSMPYLGETMRVVALRDITDMKLVEQELRWALETQRKVMEELRGLDEMKDTLMRAVSHDLRTPLAAILWSAEAMMAQAGSLGVEETVELLHRIVSNARSLDRMVVDILDLERLNAGSLDAAREPVDLASSVRGVVQRVMLPGVDAGRLDLESVVAVVDPPMIERVIENLLLNADRHNPVGTPIWIRVRRESNGALITVEDAGDGVGDQDKESIFEPFGRTSREGRAHPADPERGPAGIGVGLSLVRRFAELHGGRAWVEDRPGGGASFRVLLPAEDQAPGRGPRKRPGLTPGA